MQPLKNVNGENALIPIIFIDFAVQWSHVPPTVMDGALAAVVGHRVAYHEALPSGGDDSNEP